VPAAAVAAPALAPAAGAANALAPVKLVDDKFLNADSGDTIYLKGLSYFGFNK
jgi:hypothetical protein